MEVYGEQPKRFTKEWFDNFWYYYKWWTIGAVVIALFIIIGIGQIVTAPKLDLQVDYISEYGLDDNETELFKNVILAGIDDVTGNGEKEINILKLDMDLEQSIQQKEAVQNQFRLEMAFSDSYVFLMTKNYADLAERFEIFEPTSVWAGELANDRCVLSLETSRVLIDAGLKPAERELYVGVLKMRDKEKGKELEQKRYQNGIKLAKFLIGEE